MQALFVTAAGIVLLFLALGILMLSMNITAWLLPVRDKPVEAAEPAEESQAEAATQSSDLGAVIAAAAVALALAERDAGFVTSAPSGGGSAGANPWVILGRQAQMLARQRG